jgi:hypothetical protein
MSIIKKSKRPSSWPPVSGLDLASDYPASAEPSNQEIAATWVPAFWASDPVDDYAREIAVVRAHVQRVWPRLRRGDQTRYRKLTAQIEARRARYLVHLNRAIEAGRRAIAKGRHPREPRALEDQSRGLVILIDRFLGYFEPDATHVIMRATYKFWSRC